MPLHLDCLINMVTAALPQEAFSDLKLFRLSLSQPHELSLQSTLYPLEVSPRQFIYSKFET